MPGFIVTVEFTSIMWSYLETLSSCGCDWYNRAPGVTSPTSWPLGPSQDSPLEPLESKQEVYVAEPCFRLFHFMVVDLFL